MPVDNDLYDRHGEGWWDEDNPLNILHGSMTPGRFAYFSEVLTQRRRLDPTGVRALDIGCGGGFMAEEFARLGCHVVGVDPSAVHRDRSSPCRRHRTGHRLPGGVRGASARDGRGVRCRLRL